MEFLMTYGWAILIVLVAIAALFFLGVFSSKTPNTCTIEAPFNCIDSNSISPNIVLQVGSLDSVQDITVASQITMTVNGVNCPGTISPIPLRSGGKSDITCTPNPILAAGTKFNGEITITYDNKGGLTGKRSKGKFSGQMG